MIESALASFNRPTCSTSSEGIYYHKEIQACVTQVSKETNTPIRKFHEFSTQYTSQCCKCLEWSKKTFRSFGIMTTQSDSFGD